MAERSPPVPPIPAQYLKTHIAATSNPITSINRGGIIPLLVSSQAPKRQSNGITKTSEDADRQNRRSGGTDRQSRRLSGTEKSKRRSSGTINEKRKSNRLSTLSATSVRQDWTQLEVPISLQDWNTDRENPQDWPLPRKVAHTILHAMILFICYFACTTITPSHQTLADIGGDSSISLVLPFSIYLLGLTAGLLLITVVERFGHKSVLLASFAAFALFTLGSGFAHTLAALFVCRFLAGLSASSCMNICGAAIVNIWAQQIVSTTFNRAFVFLGAIAGLLIGAPITEAQGWRWTMWIILFACVLLILPLMGCSESHKQIILQRQASLLEREYTRDQDTKPLHSLRLLFTPRLFFLNMHSSITVSMVYACFAAAPLAFSTSYGFKFGQQRLPFAAMIIGVILAVTLLALHHSCFSIPDQAESDSANSATEPEARGRSRPRVSHKGGLLVITRSISISSSRRSLAAKRKSQQDPGNIAVVPSQGDARVAVAAANYLNAQPANQGKNIIPERIMLILHANLSFNNICTALQNLGLEFEPTVLAKVLVDSLPLESAHDERPTFARSKSLHRQAAQAALNEPISVAGAHATAVVATAQPPRKALSAERHLLLVLPASLILPGSLFLLAWTIKSSIHWIVPTIGLGLLGFASTIVSVFETMCMIDSRDTETVAMLVAGSTAMQHLLAFASTLFVLPLCEALGVAWAISVLAFACLLSGVAPWVQVAAYLFGAEAENDTRGGGCIDQ